MQLLVHTLFIALLFPIFKPTVNILTCKTLLEICLDFQSNFFPKDSKHLLIFQDIAELKNKIFIITNHYIAKYIHLNVSTLIRVFNIIWFYYLALYCFLDWKNFPYLLKLCSIHMEYPVHLYFTYLMSCY